MNQKFSVKAAVVIVPVLLSVFLFAYMNKPAKPRILVFSLTKGFHHSSIPKGVASLQKLGIENGFDVDTTTAPQKFTEENLKKYSAVVFLSTTGDVLNNYQEADFQRFIEAGGGFVGIHSATDTEYGWGWYTRLVGAQFHSHPQQQDAVLNIVDNTHPSTKHLPKEWKRRDEWYNFKNFNKDVKVLITIDEKSYQGGNMGSHPMAWYHEYEGGRAFYTEFGHTDESYDDPQYLKHVLGGIQYAIGNGQSLNYGKVKSQRVPDADRFVKTVLAQGVLFEPTEMAILPNNNILVSQRRGEVLMYNSKTKKVKQVGMLDVYAKTKNAANSEEGLLGIAADPNFAQNNYVYLFYSPIDTSVNRLSRFVFKNDTLDIKSEKVVLQFYEQREICCHTGGSIAFGPDNMLYVSTGDNSTPFDEGGQKFVNHGYGPLNDDPGHHQYDARRSAGNTNDLRGKILRIKLNADGSYTIPEGNLFSKGTEKTRPEIYVMGDRNPYRISVDKKTGFVYWGEVGPDANVDSMETRGPRGYDEVNQARKAGFFGWPLFVGGNYPYREYDYTTGKSGKAFDPQHPVNNSRNNTGLTDLPPVSPPFIYYPYALSPEFPELGTGGRTAMAGPVYYTSDYPQGKRYPDYYNGKLFIYEWIRNWIKVVTMKPNGDLDKIEPFMDGTPFSNISDMEVAPDGTIYVLEYGSGWFSGNPDAGISRLDYIAGNRPPKVQDIVIKKASGAIPYTLKAGVKAVDPEKNGLTYIWSIGTRSVTTKVPMLTNVISKPGDYKVSVKVVDSENASAKSNEVTVVAGNEAPIINIATTGNKSFYFADRPVTYAVKVTDKGDQVTPANLFISTDYLQGKDKAGANLGHKQVAEGMVGKSIMLSLDCKACHKTSEVSVGPSFTAVAKKYQKDKNAGTAHLVQKIIKGGSGVWGEVSMPAHPALKEDDSKQIVNWILSLSDGEKKSLPGAGKLSLDKGKLKENTVFALTASYTDNGQGGVRPLASTQALYLRGNNVDASEFASTKGFTVIETDGSKSLAIPGTSATIKTDKYDLTGIKTLQFNGNSRGVAGTYKVEVRTDAAGGMKIGSGILTFGANENTITGTVPLTPVADGKMHAVYITVTPVQAAAKSEPVIKTLTFAAK